MDDRLPEAVRCVGAARYAIRCRRMTRNPSHLCGDHSDQDGAALRGLYSIEDNKALGREAIGA